MVDSTFTRSQVIGIERPQIRISNMEPDHTYTIYVSANTGAVFPIEYKLTATGVLSVGLPDQEPAICITAAKGTQYYSLDSFYSILVNRDNEFFTISIMGNE